MEKIQAVTESEDRPEAVLRCIYRELRGFMDKYAALFQDKADADFLAEFTAESMLTWTLAGRSFEDVSSILLQLF